MSSKRKSHPVKIASDSTLFPPNRSMSQLCAPPPLYRPSFPSSPTFRQHLMRKENDEEHEPDTDMTEVAETLEVCTEPPPRKVNDQRESMNEILKKLALKSQENILKAKEENCR